MNHLLTILLAAALQDETDNPEFGWWKGFQPGAWVRLKQVSEAGGARREGETTIRLVESGPQKVVLEMTTPSGSRRLDVPARKPASEVWQSRAARAGEKSAEIEAGGRKLPCTVVEWKQDQDTITLWTCPQVPGGLVRSVHVPGGAPAGTSNSTLLLEWGLEPRPAGPGGAHTLPAEVNLARFQFASFCDAAAGRFAYVLPKGQNQCLVLDGVPGPEFLTVRPPVFSRDGRRSAYAGTDASGMAFVVDGKPGDRYRGFFSPQSGLGQIAFSPDGSKVAWVAPYRGNVSLYIDGRPGKEYYSVRELRFAPEGTPTFLAALPQEPLRQFFVRGDVETPAGPSNPPSPDGKRAAELVASGRLAAYKIDGKKGEDFEEVRGFLWSPTGASYAHLASNRSKNETFVVHNGKKSEPWGGVGESLTFSADGRRLAYAASDPKTREWFIVLDQKRSAKVTPFNGAITLSADGKRLAYPQLEAAGTCLVVDGKRGPAFSQLGVPIFSPDGRHVAYWAEKALRDRFNSLTATKRIVLVDDKPSEEFDAVSEPAFAPDGKELRFFALRGREVRLERVPLR